jgi:hypothetical protein
MEIMKHTALAFALAALVILWGVPASAQTVMRIPSTNITVEPPEGGTLSTFNGFEVATGQQEAEGTETYGWVCYGKTTGALPGNFTLIANYNTPLEQVTAGLAQSITSGNWTLPVYMQTIMGTTYMGVLYGTVTSGTIQRDIRGYSETMTVQLQITGGTQTMVGWKGTAVFDATINRGPIATFYGPYGPPPMKGSLTFYF